MKKFAAVVLMFAAVPVLATLDIVAKDKEGDGKVVGTCDGGKSKIVYTKTAAAAPAKAEAKK
jgi:hypothetical protein